jgi:hypothetical protein
VVKLLQNLQLGENVLLVGNISFLDNFHGSLFLGLFIDDFVD